MWSLRRDDTPEHQRRDFSLEKVTWHKFLEPAQTCLRVNMLLRKWSNRKSVINHRTLIIFFSYQKAISSLSRGLSIISHGLYLFLFSGKRKKKSKLSVTVVHVALFRSFIFHKEGIAFVPSRIYGLICHLLFAKAVVMAVLSIDLISTASRGIQFCILQRDASQKEVYNRRKGVLNSCTFMF